MHREFTLRRPAAVLATTILWLMAASQAFAQDTLSPPVVDRVLPAGGTATVEKELHLDGLPAKADIIVAIDTTGSMGLALAQAKLDAVDICADVKAAILGARFAAVEFQDYPVSPYGGPGDSPYELHTLGFTDNCATFSAGVAAMTLGFGGDSPESNNRVHFEAYSEAAFGAPSVAGGRDPEATQFLIILADNVPHSTVAFGACPSTGTLSDPGGNGVNESGAGDDIETPAAIAGLNATDIDLFYISYNTGPVALPCHEDLAAATGGDAVPSSAASDIGAFIIAQAEATPYTVSLEVSLSCPINIAFGPLSPPGPYTGEQTIAFTETITAPTIVGNYTCTVTAVMTPGGSTTAVETVNVTVIPGPPANLTLTPPNDTNTVGDEHCVTATVTDQFGNPIPGAPVQFTVSGANTNAGVRSTGANGQAVFCYVGTITGTDQITARLGPLTQTVSKTWVAGAPATIVLTPAADTNTVDDQHCVTATVRDQFGNPTPGITVRFSVTPATFRTPPSGSATTNASGQATFCYTSALPGADTITAYADTDNDSVNDAAPADPEDTARKTWVIPANNEDCKVTNGGWIITSAGNRANFGGNAKGAGPKGNENYLDHGLLLHVKSTRILAVTCSADGTSASIFGTAKVAGLPGEFDFRIDVRDLGEPGSSDRYRLRLSNGYDSGDQQLSGGNIQIH